VVARGKIILAAKRGEEIPLGWAVDEEGLDTRNPVAALGGAMLPFGGVKGYALAVIVEILSVVLSGAAFGPHVGSIYEENDSEANVGHCVVLLDISRWMSLGDYYERMEQFLEELKSVPVSRNADTTIFYPGERRHLTREEQLRRGIEIPGEVEEELRELGSECGVQFPSLAGESR
ncbi:MAG: Ldh family oxidoreductase, partial [Actinobacteria bacterium]|nr:Ldh family oxidoreductase [Actinomycetota bacterium]